MKTKTKTITDELCETIDRAVKPPMSKRDAIDVLEAIVDHCSMSIEALREEMDDDE